MVEYSGTPSVLEEPTASIFKVEVTNLIKLDEAEQQIPAPGEVSTLIFCP
jgi:hypothetical protein